MNIQAKVFTKSLRLAGLGVLATLLLVASSLNAQENQAIKIDGSSTVYPITQKIVTDYRRNKQQSADIEINFSGTGKNSGTFDYFTEAIVGKAKASRNDVITSEDDDILVEEVSRDPNAIAYFGLAYYEEQVHEMKALGINSSAGAVLPSVETVENAQYQPLSRPLFIYVNAAAAQKSQDLRQLIDYYLAQAPALVKEVGYVPLPEEAYHINKVSFHQGEVGTVFEGKSQFNLTIPELLRKQARF